jgi:membrane-bound lytic murein transglycosylase B
MQGDEGRLGMAVFMRKGATKGVIRRLAGLAVVLGVVVALAALPADGEQGARPVEIASGDHDVERSPVQVDAPFHRRGTSTTTTTPPAQIDITPAAVSDANGSPSNSPVVDALAASGIPEVAMRAYLAAQGTMATRDPSCGLRWSLVAALGRVESNHGRYQGAQLREDGTGTKLIRGIPLDGRPGVMTIRDTDGGQFDGDPVYDRAIGPMQFIPSSWRFAGADGNGDGRADPDNIFDAALAAAGYLCAGDTNLTDRADRASAVFRYNHSAEYVQTVMSLADLYERGPVVSPPSSPPPPAATMPELPSRELPPASPPDPPVDVPAPPTTTTSSTSTSTSTTAPCPTTTTTLPPDTTTSTETTTTTTTTTLPGDPCPTTTTSTTTTTTTTTSTTSTSTSTTQTSAPPPQDTTTSSTP